MTPQDEWQAAVAGAIQKFGGLDILVNNAGTADLAGIDETSLADWRRAIEIDRAGCSWG